MLPLSIDTNILSIERKNKNIKSIKMSLDSALSLYEQIKTEWSKPKQDLKKCGILLDQLKVSIRGKRIKYKSFC